MCDSNSGKLKSVTIINCSDIKSISKDGKIDIKRKYGDFHRPIFKIEPKLNEVKQYLRDNGKLYKI